MRNAKPYIALGISILLNTAALIFLKGFTASISFNGNISFSLLIEMLSSVLFWIGAASFIAGLFFWIESLKQIPLSVAYPTAALSYIFIVPFSVLFFDEPITLPRILGIFVIVAGVTFLYHKPQRRTN